VKYNDNSNDQNDRWKLYLFSGLKENLRKRLYEMISHDENEIFFAALKLEYGYNKNKNLKEAFLLYKESSMANSRNFLSMTRLFDIYRTKDNKFKGMIENDKNLELIYLFKSFSYLPIRLLRGNISNKTFPIDLAYTIASFMDKNNLSDTKRIFTYIDELMKSKKYDEILSQNDCNLIKGL
jgi:TPR repeat protein